MIQKTTKIISFIAFMFWVFSSGITFCQVGINNTLPNSSSMLDIVSTNKGLLIPRMTSSQRIAILAPATGLMVYETTTNQFFYFDGIIWRPMASNSSAWNTTGNSGTSPISNFLGTIDLNDLVIKTNNIERMRVLNGGNIGIGTVAPASLLTVSGELRLESDNARLILERTTGPNRIDFNDTQLLIFRSISPTNSNGIDRVTFTPTGSVGIGTTTPSQMLSVSNSINVDNSNANSGNLINALIFGGSGSNTGIASKRTAGGNQLGMDFYQGGINRMRIWNDGNVAIGQSSSGSLVPSADFTILDTALTSTSDVAIFTAHHSGSAGTTWRMGSVEVYTEGLNNIGYSSHVCPLNANGGANLGSATGTKYDGFRWGTLFCTIAPNISSDTTLKEEIMPVLYGLNQIRKINPISYKLKKEYAGADNMLSNEDKRTHIGFSAQELKQIMPEVVSSTTWVSDNEKGYVKATSKTLGVYYDEIIPVVINAVKDIDRQQQAIINTLTISDFGTEQKTGNEIEIPFHADFIEKLQGNPVVTVTSLQPEITLYISSISKTGFTIKTNSANISAVSFSWMAMSKINKGAVENKETYTDADHAQKLKVIKASEAALPSSEDVINTRQHNPVAKGKN